MFFVFHKNFENIENPLNKKKNLKINSNIELLKSLHILIKKIIYNSHIKKEYTNINTSAIMKCKIKLSNKEEHHHRPLGHPSCPPMHPPCSA